MKTAVDSNVFIDILIDAPRQSQSRQLLKSGRREGFLVISSVVFAELMALMADSEELNDFLDTCGVREVESLNQPALVEAGKAWRRYNDRRPSDLICPQCGEEVQAFCSKKHHIAPRQHILTDFFVGAHAAVRTDQLITHDQGFVQRYFPQLRAIP